MRGSILAFFVVLALTGCSGSLGGTSAPASRAVPATATSTTADNRSPAPSRPEPDPTPEARVLEPQAVIELEGALDLFVGDDGLWVRDAERVWRIDTARNQLAAPIIIPEDFGPFVVAGGAVWITAFEHNEVVAYSIESGQVLTRIEVGLHPNVIVWADGSVWGYNLHGRFIARIDPVSRMTVHAWDEDVFAAAPTVAPSNRMVWWPAADARRAIGIDGASNELAASLQLPIEPCAVTATSRAIVATACGTGDVVQLRADETNATGVVRWPGTPGRLVELGGRIWTPLAPSGQAPDSLVAIDSSTLQPLEAVTVEAEVRDVGYADAAVWITTPNAVLRFSEDDFGEP